MNDKEIKKLQLDLEKAYAKLKILENEKQEDLEERELAEQELSRFVEELQYNKELMEENASEFARLNVELEKSQSILINRVRNYQSEIEKSLEENQGYIFANIRNEYKGYFQDLLRGFEEYAKLKGYNLSFSFDNTLFNKIGFKFIVHENPNDVNTSALRTDLMEYLTKVINGGDFSKLPEIINLGEHKLIVSQLQNRIKFLNQNLEIIKGWNLQYQNLIDTIVHTERGFYNIKNPDISFTKEIKVIKNIFKDNSNITIKNIGSVINEDSEVLEYFTNIVNRLIELLENSPSSIDQKILEEILKIRTETTQNATISTEQKKSYKEKITNLLQYVNLGKDVIKYLTELYELLS